MKQAVLLAVGATMLCGVPLANAGIGTAVVNAAVHAGKSADDSKIIWARDVDQILDVAKGFGSAELSKDDEGDPRIDGMIDGIRYSVLFYGCGDSHDDCKDIQFRAGWSDTKVTIKDVNEWNRTKRFGSTYLDDENDPILDMSVNINYGVTRHNLEDTFDWWSVVVKSFRDELIDKGE